MDLRMVGSSLCKSGARRVDGVCALHSWTYGIGKGGRGGGVSCRDDNAGHLSVPEQPIAVLGFLDGGRCLIAEKLGVLLQHGPPCIADVFFHGFCGGGRSKAAQLRRQEAAPPTGAGLTVPEEARLNTCFHQDLCAFHLGLELSKRKLYARCDAGVAALVRDLAGMPGLPQVLNIDRLPDGHLYILVCPRQDASSWHHLVHSAVHKREHNGRLRA
mmetsp:Transcript_29460/g.83092  ORF Transcript_29460/g.83092 Transcript_29460/m.83092 type:complete len:215 (+) Transcript_29460:364-1008(+)